MDKVDIFQKQIYKTYKKFKIKKKKLTFKQFLITNCKNHFNVTKLLSNCFFIVNY